MAYASISGHRLEYSHYKADRRLSMGMGVIMTMKLQMLNPGPGSGQRQGAILQGVQLPGIRGSQGLEQKRRE